MGALLRKWQAETAEAAAGHRFTAGDTQPGVWRQADCHRLARHSCGAGGGAPPTHLLQCSLATAVAEEEPGAEDVPHPPPPTYPTNPLQTLTTAVALEEPEAEEVAVSPLEAQAVAVTAGRSGLRDVGLGMHHGGDCTPGVEAGRQVGIAAAARFACIRRCPPPGLSSHQ